MLQELVDALGPAVAELVYLPEGRPLPAGMTAIADPNEALPPIAGGIALLVGIAAAAPEALELVRSAAERDYAAVVIKRRGSDLQALQAAASEAGLAVIVAADEVPWRQFDALLSTALSSNLPGPDDSGETARDQLFSVANAIAAVVGGSVAIEDLAQRVLAYSSVPGQRIDELRRQGILDRRVPRGPADEELYRRVMANQGVIRFPQMEDDLPRAAVALRAGNLPLGTLWAIESEDGLSPQAEAAIVDGAKLAALHMLQAQSAPDLERLRRGDLLRALLEGVGSPDLAWSRLGFRSGDHLALVALAPSWIADMDDSLLITHVAREAARICAVLRPDAPVMIGLRAVYVLVAGGRADDAATRLAQRLVTDVSHTLRGPIFAGVSGDGVGPRALPRLRDEVDQILRVGAGGSASPGVAHLADVQSSVMLLHLRDELERHPELQHPAIRQLLQHDAERATELAASLLAWLEAGQNVQLAAKRLHVHANTLRYRLERIRQTARLDLDDADQRLAAWLELRLLADLR